ncbi:hypothetical protein CB0940_01290 [Cercospora beticola]|uniref:Uncharacterized protein n=1 Tax=Cercospora beticola TaxID=122368 RepID=A0A2G5I773_CERBT|nr:hypothetical protein CB0940_01290 [Cercospora beticola]PIB00630.1 hypothetical protein CB0940_01290 [Cercospora beticola]WPA96724.1 hypothetical protein RHO25_001332 [Cercospora beticola]CAK1354916.1 unnamed protein product [Cercospora beticola]
MRHHVVAAARVLCSTSPTAFAGSSRRCYSSVKKDSTGPGPAHLVNFVYEPFPQPFNCTTFTQTRAFATDPSHPLYIKIQRRVALHDPQDFRWVVRCPMDVNKKPTYRHAVQKKLRRAFRHALTQRGLDSEGKPLSDADLAKLKRVEGTDIVSAAPAPTERLSGALCLIFVNDQKRVLTAKGCEVRAEAERVLDKVLQIWHAAKRGQQQGRSAPGKRPFQVQRRGRATMQQWQLGKRRETPGSSHP